METNYQKYVLMTSKSGYFVEYLLDYLVVANNCSEAMIFDDIITAEKFVTMLFKCTNIKFYISPIIY